MLTTFGQEDGVQFRQIMLAATGAVIVLFIVVMAIDMIVQGNKGLKALKREMNVYTVKERMYGKQE